MDRLGRIRGPAPRGEGADPGQAFLMSDPRPARPPLPPFPDRLLTDRPACRLVFFDAFGYRRPAFAARPSSRQRDRLTMKPFVLRCLRAVGLYAPVRALWFAILSGFNIPHLVNRWRYRREAAGLPLPPAHLDFLATGTRNVAWYIASGKWAFRSLTTALERHL